jgi:hypothetical protein
MRSIDDEVWLPWDEAVEFLQQEAVFAFQAGFMPFKTVGRNAGKKCVVTRAGDKPQGLIGKEAGGIQQESREHKGEDDPSEA